VSIADLLPPFVALPSEDFLMGSPEQALSDLARRYGGTRESYREESPQHSLRLPPFAIARTPVTNALYAAYVSASGAAPPLHWHGPQPPAALSDHPVVNVSWQEALGCCAWISSIADCPAALTSYNLQSAIRLPTEAEWEYAARGVDGRSFPWGEEPDPQLANTRESALAGTTPVGSYPAGASPCGALDMAGNVWEWTASLDRLYPYNASDGREDLAAPGRRILRGGCYANPQGFARSVCRFRMPPTMRNEFIGFRLAVSILAMND
jgi:formylglycine-generating enzyme required for sulfatase activity